MSESRFVIAATLEPCEVGEEFKRLPPHVTIVPPFTIPAEVVPVLHSDLAEVLPECGPIQLVGGGIEHFEVGEGKELAVRRVGGLMFSVHAAARAIVLNRGSKFDMKHTGLEWTPHVTDHAALRQGEHRQLDAVQLFGYDKGLRRVQAVYSLTEQAAAA